MAGEVAREPLYVDPVMVLKGERIIPGLSYRVLVTFLFFLLAQGRWWSGNWD
jgi:hypothetical protein